MSKISKQGYEQIQVIKNALDSMYDKLDQTTYSKTGEGKDAKYVPNNVFLSVQAEFEAIAGIVAEAGTWEEVTEEEKA